MSPNVMPPDNAEIDITSGNPITIGGANVVGTTNDIQINPDAIGPISKFELWHNPANPTAFTDVTGVRIPFGNTLLTIVKKPDGNSQWSIGGTILTAYTDRTSRVWRPDITTCSFSTANSYCYYTRTPDPLGKNAPPWPRVAQADFVSLKLRTTSP